MNSVRRFACLADCVGDNHRPRQEVQSNLSERGSPQAAFKTRDSEIDPHEHHRTNPKAKTRVQMFDNDANCGQYIGPLRIKIPISNSSGLGGIRRKQKTYA
jgi:hypothetical protein